MALDGLAGARPAQDVGGARVLFVCPRNSGASQMCQALFAHACGRRHRVQSAGVLPARRVDPYVVQAMAELGFDLSARRPRLFTRELARQADIVVGIGCGDVFAAIPGRRFLEWDVPDPQGGPLERVREIRDELSERVDGLVSELNRALARTGAAVR